MNHQPSTEKSQLGHEKLSPPLFTYWLALCGWALMRTTHTLQWYDLTWWKKSCHRESGRRGVALQSMKVERLKHKENKSIIGPAAWNHTLAKLVLKQSRLHQLLYNLLLKLFSPLLFPFLCLCEVQLNTSLWPARSFTQDHYWWKRSEWLSERERVYEGYRIFIYYPSHILM